MSDSPAAILYDSNGNPIGVDANPLAVDGVGTAGVPAGGVVSVQGVTSGQPLPVSDGGGSLTVDGSVTVSTADVVTSGTIAANGVSVTSATLSGQSSLGVQVSGTWVGTLVFEASTDGTNFSALVLRSSNSGTLVTSATANGLWRTSAAGFQAVRVRSWAWTSGTASITIRASVGVTGVVLLESLPAGSSTIGAIVGAGTAGNPVGGVVTVQGSSGSTPVIIVESTTTTASSAVIAATTSTVTLLNANAGRRGATVFNNSASAKLYLKCGTGATSSSFTVMLAPLAYYEVPFAYTGVLTGTWSVNTGDAQVSEFT